MKKTVLKRSLALGALMAFVITGNALAATATHYYFQGDLANGFEIITTMDHSNHLINGQNYSCYSVGGYYYNGEKVIDNDVNYKFTINSGTYTTNSGISGLMINSNTADLTFNKSVGISVSTDLTGTGNNAINGLAMDNGKITFNDNLLVDVTTTNENGKAAYGISAGGNTLTSFNGSFVDINVNTATTRNEQKLRTETMGLTTYTENAKIVASANTVVDIDVIGSATGDYASPVYGIVAEMGNIDIKGTADIYVESNGNISKPLLKDNKDNLNGDQFGLAVGIKAIDGYSNSSVTDEGIANIKINNSNIVVKNNAIGGKAVGIMTNDFDGTTANTTLVNTEGDLSIDVIADIARGVEVKNGTSVKLGSDKTENIIINTASNNPDNKETINVGICAVKGSTVDINTKNLTVNTSATGAGWAYGISAQNNSVPADNAEKFATINIKADNILVNSTAEQEGHSTGLVTMSQGRMNVDGNIEVNADDAISARGDSVLKVNTGADNTNVTKLNGDINFSYDGNTSGTRIDTTVEVKLTGAESVWNGNTKVTWDAKTDKNGNVTHRPDAEELKIENFSLTLADNAQWNAQKVSIEGEYNEDGSSKSDSGVQSTALNNLTLDKGIVNLTDAEEQAVQVENISGEGTVIVNDTENKMQIIEKNDLQKLNVATTRAYAERLVQQYDMNDALQLIADQVSDETVDRAKDSAATDVEMAETAVTGLATASVKDGLVVLNTIKEAVNTSNAGISNMGAIALMTWRQENNDMNKRLGELRDSSGEHGVWVRMTRGEGKYKSIKNQYNSYQIGYDEKLSVNKNWTVGAAFTYTDGESSFNKGTGENTHKGLALYGSYLGDDGSFIDLIAKYARLDHEFDVTGGAGKGDYDTNGYSLSAEYGKRFTKDNGLWIEPQVELTYGKVGSADYLTSNGVRVRQDGMDSFVGRLGFALGKDLAKDKGNVYLRASYLYDFDGDTSMSFAKGRVSRTIEQDLGGGWWEVGLGTNINFSDAAHLYFDVEKTYGGDVATPWQWNVGMRWSF
ncbi:MAG: autotransporter outer membrane beta-barrel domain-containing protein [Phascolarctobacterium sp.]|nr:autotransporter outer membrane beta-barrel domain-containing protein [Phascolarctobacterium sp.]